MDIEKIVREYINKTFHMSLATARNNIPWVCEVHFAYDDDLNLYFRSLESRRHSQEIANNSQVSGNIIDKYDLGDEVVGLYFEGEAKLLESPEEREVAAMAIHDRLKAENVLEESDREDGHKLYMISVSNWYVFGRFGEPRGRKYKLEWGK